MKLISCASFKGGAGKTTALMGICSSLLVKNKRIALFEADENRPLSKWRENSLKLGTWDERCKIFLADEMEALEKSYEQAQVEGFDYGLADTRGGSSELNNTIIASSDFLALPTQLTPLDIDETLATYRYVVEIMIAEKLEIPTAILRQRVPTGKLTISQINANELLNELPLFEHPMYERDALAAMKQRGMLHKTTEKLNDNPFMRMQIRSHQTALNEMHFFSNFIEQTLLH